MISIKRLMSGSGQTGQTEDVSKAMLTCYDAAIEAIAHYALEIDPAVTGDHRAYLASVRDQLKNLETVDNVLETQSLLRAGLRNFRDLSNRHLQKLHDELDAAVRSFQDVIVSLAIAGDSNDRRLQTEVESMQTLLTLNDLATIKAELRKSTERIQQCMEAMKSENSVMVAQFKDEIRILQKRAEVAEAKANADPVTGLMTRSEIETRLKQELDGSLGMGLIYLRIENIRQIRAQYGPLGGNEVLIAFGKRLANGVSGDALLARWNDDTFVARIISEKLEAVKLTRDLTTRLSGKYPTLLDGRVLNPVVQVTMGTLEFPASAGTAVRTLTKAYALVEKLGSTGTAPLAI